MTRLLLLALVLALGAAPACNHSESENSAPVPFTMQGDHVTVDQASRFFKRLEKTETRATTGDARELRAVGQMVALANPSGELSGSRISWVQLDPKLTTLACSLAAERRPLPAKPMASLPFLPVTLHKFILAKKFRLPGMG